MNLDMKIRERIERPKSTLSYLEPPQKGQGSLALSRRSHSQLFRAMDEFR
jgi:hypothetical protein